MVAASNVLEDAAFKDLNFHFNWFKDVVLDMVAARVTRMAPYENRVCLFAQSNAEITAALNFLKVKLLSASDLFWVKGVLFRPMP